MEPMRIESSKSQWSVRIGAVIAYLIAVAGTAPGYADEAPSLERRLLPITQAPLWPPSEILDQNGDFLVIGQVLTEIAPGVIVPIPNQAALVSKETVPPLDSRGVEDYTNVLGAPYRVIRHLDLRPGSPDLDLQLYTVSFGPFEGSFSGGPRMPMEGESPYNLNSSPPLCPELFPTPSQRLTFKRPSFPLHATPIAGFQGDQVAYDVVTGTPYDPRTASGPGCGTGCSGENPADVRRTTPVTLGEYLKAKGEVKVTLSQYNSEIGAYTAARFDFSFKHLLPNSVYTIWAVRANMMRPRPELRLPTPLGLPNIVVTDKEGTATFSTELPNPFPDPTTDDKGLRVIGLSIGFHSDFQTWGACPTRLGPGADTHVIFNTLVNGTGELTTFITKPAP